MTITSEDFLYVQTIDDFLLLAKPEEEKPTPKPTDHKVGTGAAAHKAATDGKTQPGAATTAHPTAVTATTTTPSKPPVQLPPGAGLVKPKPRAVYTNATPDMKKPVPMQRLLRDEWERYQSGKEIEVYWVDQREWRPAVVMMAWDSRPEGLFVEAKFVGYPGVANGKAVVCICMVCVADLSLSVGSVYAEHLNLLNASEYNRVRLREIGHTPEGQQYVTQTHGTSLHPMQFS